MSGVVIEDADGDETPTALISPGMSGVVIEDVDGVSTPTALISQEFNAFKQGRVPTFMKVFTVTHQIWADLIRIGQIWSDLIRTFRLSLPAIAS